MERADLLSSGLMFAAEGMLLLWTAILIWVAFVVFAPSRKSAPGAATIASTTVHGAEEPTPPRSLPEALPARTVVGCAVRPAD
jgi:hypothetical protein